jgi:hypothetical protein
MSEGASFLNSLESGYRLDLDFGSKQVPNKKSKSRSYDIDPYITENKVLINVLIFISCMSFM